MKETITVIGIEVNEIGAVLSIEGGDVVTVHDEQFRDSSVIQAVKNAVTFAHVLGHVPFMFYGGAEALYRLAEIDGRVAEYSRLGGHYAWKRDDIFRHYRADFQSESAMREDAAKELAAGNDIFGPSAAVEPQEDGTFLLTMWSDGATVRTDFVETALTLAGFTSDDSE
ncbi:hypothetical protein [Cohnella phaseoli]|uniref:Uncharacterized protein n=1 Tax=Cohnella phaseoli TaxID=456490 RepID=A0A3D9KJU3_9BACL|nr:hypothetical protein [Cohnella phaseoli]RED86194.1 hypothetical protein DFP98_10345 [Cohnella phaseoli]